MRQRISTNTLLEMYENQIPKINDQAILQILGFEKSAYGP